ncbi:hypothetical protein M9H77_01941 [Catharanthus roseus]|uniref:Uncharacterized protein n=1 Tax=Catharanthus roseus TaxID=4058 RepID=A0ACC0C7D6_CATRO|nr:hypothetical protein M9H77_01941 [Catharanthus roseus]
MACKHGGANKSRTKLRVDDEEEVPIKRQGPYETKKCGCLFKLKCEQMATRENWQLFVYDERHNHAIVYIKYTTSLKKNRMQGQNTIEEILCLSAQPSYTVFYRNCDDGNVLSDIIVSHSTSIQMMRKWSYVLIMDTMYKTNK